MSLGKLFLGIGALLIGLMFLLDTFDIVPDAWRWWPLIVIVAAVFIIISALTKAGTPWYKTEKGWNDFAEKMEKKFEDEEKWEKLGKKMEQMGKDLEKEFDEDKQD